jgi:hypothetical protein
VFERFVVVDWSANSTPKTGRDSIWIAVRHGAGMSTHNPATRHAAEAILLDLLDSSARTLVGVDFSLGLPAGTAVALGRSDWSSTAALLCELVTDDERNANNRFDVAAELNRRIGFDTGPFWGCPPSGRSACLASTKPESFGPLGEWRRAEQVVRDQGRRPFSSWQLLGAGAVGSQSLLGIPMVVRLVQALGERGAVWPFTTGLRPPTPGPGAVVVAEVWPSLFPLDQRPGEVRDAAQVRCTADHLARLDAAGALRELFDPGSAGVARSEVEREEGWILGVTG